MERIRLNLSELQKLFYDHIVKNEKLGSLEALVQASAKIPSIEEAMQIYVRGYPARLTEALGALYPAIWFVLGDEEFFEIAKRYIHKYPSQSYTLSLYGFEFANFLIDQAIIEEYPFLNELAEFELSYNKIFHARPSFELSSQDFYKEVSQDPKLPLGLVSSAICHHFQHNIYEIWQACKDEEATDPCEWFGEEFVCLYKHQGSVFIKKISRAVFLILEKIKEGTCLEDLFQDSLVQSLGPEEVQSAFSWIALSGLVEIRISPQRKTTA